MKNRIFALWAKTPYTIKYRPQELVNAIFLFLIGFATIIDIFPAYISLIEEHDSIAYYLYNFNAVNLMSGALLIIISLLTTRSEYSRGALSLVRETIGYVVVFTSSLAYLIGYIAEWGRLGYAGCVVLWAIFLVSQMLVSSAKLMTMRMRLREIKDGT